MSKENFLIPSLHVILALCSSSINLVRGCSDMVETQAVKRIPFDQIEKDLDDLEKRIRNINVENPYRSVWSVLSIYLSEGEKTHTKALQQIKPLHERISQIATNLGLETLLEEWRIANEFYYSYEREFTLDGGSDFVETEFISNDYHELIELVSKSEAAVSLMKEVCDAINKIGSNYPQKFIESHWSQIVQANQEYIVANFRHTSNNGLPSTVGKMISY